jgi:hypothetical protein
MGPDDIKYHGDRALTELDLAGRAASYAAARAHLELSALHLDRMRELSDGEAAARELLSAG